MGLDDSAGSIDIDDGLTHDGSSSDNDVSTKSKQGKQDETWVRCSKVSVIVFLVATTAVCSALTYMVTSRAEERNFEQQVRAFLNWWRHSTRVNDAEKRNS